MPSIDVDDTEPAAAVRSFVAFVQKRLGGEEDVEMDELVQAVVGQMEMKVSELRGANVREAQLRQSLDKEIQQRLAMEEAHTAGEQQLSDEMKAIRTEAETRRKDEADRYTARIAVLQQKLETAEGEGAPMNLHQELEQEEAKQKRLKAEVLKEQQHVEEVSGQLRRRDKEVKEVESALSSCLGELEEARQELKLCRKQEERAEADGSEMKAQMEDWRLQVEQRQRQARQLQKELQRMRTEHAKGEASHQRVLEETKQHVEELLARCEQLQQQVESSNDRHRTQVEGMQRRHEQDLADASEELKEARTKERTATAEAGTGKRSADEEREMLQKRLEVHERTSKETIADLDAALSAAKRHAAEQEEQLLAEVVREREARIKAEAAVRNHEEQSRQQVVKQQQTSEQRLAARQAEAEAALKQLVATEASVKSMLEGVLSEMSRALGKQLEKVAGQVTDKQRAVLEPQLLALRQACLASGLETMAGDAATVDKSSLHPDLFVGEATTLTKRMNGAVESAETESEAEAEADSGGDVIVTWQRRQQKLQLEQQRELVADATKNKLVAPVKSALGAVGSDFVRRCATLRRDLDLMVAAKTNRSEAASGLSVEVVSAQVAPLQQEFEAKLSAAKSRAKQQCVNGIAALLRRLLLAVDELAAEIAKATAVVGAPVRLIHPCEHAATVLVTAASGFVGSHVLVELVSLGYKVRGVMDRKQWLAPSSNRYTHSMY
jgi:hypothetical protein